MLAEEFNAADLNKSRLLIKDDLFILSPFISAPISSRCDQFVILDLHDLSDERQACNVQVLAQTLGIEESHEGSDDGIVRDVLEGHFVENTT